MDTQLLTVKFYPPPLRPSVVRRHRLVEKLNQGLQEGTRLTLITAPAGYGKTTLALEWITSLNRHYSWLSLDRSDNHPIQFLTYLIAALGQVDEEIGNSLTCALEANVDQDEATRVQALLTLLVNHVATIRTPFTLVLDDYHTLTDLGVHQALEFILDHQPPQMHVVIATRQDPLLPLSKLRSRGQLTEIRLGELRFTQPEADQFLNETMRLGLRPEEVAALQLRTEGWIAGLQLAALSLAELPPWSQTAFDPKTRSESIRAFAGDDRHVADYLLDEVLSRQPEEMQRFLLHTSILKRLSGPLCDYLLEYKQPSSQQILESLEHANLFVIPLDNRRQWYRYHHLFADLLNSRLQSSDPDLVAALHRRASQWFQAAGEFAEAVDHALLAEDFDSALHLIEELAGVSIWASGELPVLLNWARRLPEELLRTRPRLCLYCGRALFFNGQVHMADKYLQEAEKALRARERSGAATDELWGVLFTNQATVRAMCGNSQEALELAARAKALVPAEDVSTHARIAHALGMAEYLAGNVSAAQAGFSQAIRLAQQANNRNLGLDVIACLALAQILAGHLDDAEHVCQNVLAMDGETRSVPAAGPLFLALAVIQYERYDLHRANETLATSIELARKAGWLHVLWQAYLLQAQIHQALREPQAAQEALRQAEQVAVRYGIPRVSRMISAYRASIELAEGNTDFPRRWAEAYDHRSPAEHLRDFEELTLGRVLLSGGHCTEALSLLDGALEKARSAGRMTCVIEATVLRAQALEASGEHQGAIESMIRAVELAEPEGFIRPFLDGGKCTRDLLIHIRQKVVPARVMGYSRRWLETFDDGRPVLATAKAADVLVEPLSERELEVLRLMSDGLSNPEIAGRLYLSVNTLRAHTTHIFRKLDVHNRVQAISRARELGLMRAE